MSDLQLHILSESLPIAALEYLIVHTIGMYKIKFAHRVL